MNTIGIFDFCVRSYECGADGVATLASICNYMQEAASKQAEQAGFSKSNFAAEGKDISWVLTRMSVKMTRYPKWEERVTVATWPCGGRKIIANRDFEVCVGDEVIGVATSEWMLIDLATRKIVAVPQQVYDKANDERPRAMPGHEFPKLRWGERSETGERGEKGETGERGEKVERFKARKGDIDLNGHVNNVHYIEWLVEALPADAGAIGNFEIAFKSETLAGDEVVAEAVEVRPGVYAAHVAAADGKDHVVAEIQTTEKKGSTHE